MIEIPLTSEAEQIFTIELNSVVFSFRVIYNTRLGIWSADISSGGNELVNGVALVTGLDIMAPYNIGLTNLYVINIAVNNAEANSSNLGTDVRLYQLTDEEVSSVTTV